ncbi:hypothetical protein BDR22DRAFT_958915 [Usnea florida]
MHSQLPHLLSTLSISSSPSFSAPTPQQQQHQHQKCLQLESLDEMGVDTPRALWATGENEQGSRKGLVGHDGYLSESVHRSNKGDDGVDDDGDVDMEMEREDVPMEDVGDGDNNNNNTPTPIQPHHPPPIPTFSGRNLKPKIDKRTPNPQPSPWPHRARDGTLTSTPHQPPIPTFAGRNLKPKIDKQTPNPQPSPERPTERAVALGLLRRTTPFHQACSNPLLHKPAPSRHPLRKNTPMNRNTIPLSSNNMAPPSARTSTSTALADAGGI